MTEKNFAYYDTNTGLIENVILLNPDNLNSFIDFPPEGYALQEMPDDLTGEWSVCTIGWSYINGVFVEPPAPPKVVMKDQPVVAGAQTL